MWEALIRIATILEQYPLLLMLILISLVQLAAAYYVKNKVPRNAIIHPLDIVRYIILGYVFVEMSADKALQFLNCGC